MNPVHFSHEKPLLPLDTSWYERLKDCGSFEEYEYLGGEKTVREEEKRNFLEDPDRESPELDYPQLTIENVLQKEHDLLLLKRDVLQKEENLLVRQTYRWKINEKLAEIRMLKATLEKNDSRFLRYANFIYGKPDEAVFHYTLDAIRSKFKTLTSSENPILAREALDFLEKTFLSPSQQEPKKPNASVFETVQSTTRSEFSPFLQLIPEDASETLGAEEIQTLFSEALRQLEAEGWCVETSDNKTAISVDQENQKVLIPKNRTLLKKKAYQLLLHEIGTHAKRRIQGERSRLQLLGLGLDRYRNAEEGVATLREQALEASFSDFSGLDGHLAISLAQGLDGKKRNFREVFDFLFQYNFVLQLAKNIPPEDAQKKARNTAYTSCVRTFRGTTGKTRGSCLTKDIIYREGNIKVWEVVSQDCSEMLRFSVGKYDPSNDRHLWILSQLEIQDSDLLALESQKD